MNVTRTGKVAGLVLVSALGLTACGSDSNSSGSPSTGSSSSGSSASGISCATGSVKAAGSTFQQNIIEQWIKDYTAACKGATIDYQGIGSGAGIAQLGSGTIDFAGSDSVMKDTEQAAADKACGSPAIHIPVTAGGVALAYNLSGVKDLQLSPATIAGIFTAKITKWDDAAIKADNPGASLPSTPITAVHRSDSSGTTDVFSKFEAKTGGAAWTLGTGKELKWSNAVTGAAKSSGVSQAVTSTDGGIGYVEDSFVIANSLTAAKIKNGAGEYVAISPDSVTKAFASATVPASGNDLKVTYDFANTATGAYPITASSYDIVCSKGMDAGKAALIKSFLAYATGKGQDSASNLGFAPLPESIVSRDTAVISTLS